MSCVRVGLVAIALAAGLGWSNVGGAAADDAVFFTSEDCSGEGYVWASQDGTVESIDRLQPASTTHQVVGTDRMMYVPDPTSAPAIVEYNSRLVVGGCVVQPGSDHLVRAIRKGSVRVFKKPYVAQDRR